MEGDVGFKSTLSSATLEADGRGNGSVMPSAVILLFAGLTLCLYLCLSGLLSLSCLTLWCGGRHETTKLKPDA